MRAVRPLFLLVALAAAGCVGSPASKLADDAHMGGGHDHGRIVSGDFLMEGTDCEEAGFVAMYPMMSPSKLAGIWEQDDIRAEYGNPIHDSLGAPTPLVFPQNGNNHMGYHCKVATSDGHTQNDYIFGWVGQQIKAPAWDPGGADRHILIGGIAFGNGSIADDLRATTHADITHALSAYTTWYIDRSMPRSFAYSEYHDFEKGIYQTWSTMEAYRNVPERTIRFWWQVPADGSDAHIWSSEGHSHAGMEQPADMTWHPVYWDLRTSGGTQFVTPKEGHEIGEHNLSIDDTLAGKPEHFPPFSQPMLQSFYEHKSITFSGGHVIADVTLDAIWMH